MLLFDFSWRDFVCLCGVNYIISNLLREYIAIKFYLDTNVINFYHNFYFFLSVDNLGTCIQEMDAKYEQDFNR